jgi:hypothetical protein
MADFLFLWLLMINHYGTINYLAQGKKTVHRFSQLTEQNL